MNTIKLVTVVTLAAYLVVLVNGAPAEEALKTGVEAPLAEIGAGAREAPGEGIQTVSRQEELPKDVEDPYSPSGIGRVRKYTFLPPADETSAPKKAEPIITPPKSLSTGTYFQEFDKMVRKTREFEEKFENLPTTVIEAQVKIRAQIMAALRQNDVLEVKTLDRLFNEIVAESMEKHPYSYPSSHNLMEHVLSPLYDSVYQPEYEGEKLYALLNKLAKSAPPVALEPDGPPALRELFLNQHILSFPSVINAEVAKDLLACHMAFKEAMQHAELEITEVQVDQMGKALLKIIQHRNFHNILLRSLDYPYSKNPTRAKQLMQEVWDWIGRHATVPPGQNWKGDFELAEDFRKKGAEADFKILQVLENIQKSLKERPTVALPDHELAQLITKTEAGEAIDPSKLHAMLDRLFPLLLKQVSMGNNLNEFKTMDVVRAIVTAQLKAEPIMNVKEGDIDWILRIIRESPRLKTFYLK